MLTEYRLSDPPDPRRRRADPDRGTHLPDPAGYRRDPAANRSVTRRSRAVRPRPAQPPQRSRRLPLPRQWTLPSSSCRCKA